MKILNVAFHHTTGPKPSRNNNSHAIWTFFENRERNLPFFLYKIYATLKLSLMNIGLPKNGQLSMITTCKNMLSKILAKSNPVGHEDMMQYN